MIMRGWGESVVMTSSKISKYSNCVENWYRDGIRYVGYENKDFQ